MLGDEKVSSEMRTFCELCERVTLELLVARPRASSLFWQLQESNSAIQAAEGSGRRELSVTRRAIDNATMASYSCLEDVRSRQKSCYSL